MRPHIGANYPNGRFMNRPYRIHFGFGRGKTPPLQIRVHSFSIRVNSRILNNRPRFQKNHY
jgi:hypothetical protein